jgi:hypothetical protein
MTESSDRDELKKRLEQAKRIAGSALDPLTKERLTRLVQESEEQPRLSVPQPESPAFPFLCVEGSKART